MKSKPLIIFGAGEMAELAKFYFEKNAEYEVKAFCVDAEFRKSERFLNLPLIEPGLLSSYPADKHFFYAAIGYSGLNAAREEKYKLLKGMGYSPASYISPQCVNFSSHIGDHALILENNTLQPYCRIGSNVVLWSGNHIGHHAVIGDHCFISSHVVVSGGVKIGSSCFLGVNAAIRDHAVIGEKCVIGAGALVMRDAPPGTVFKGNTSKPSRIQSGRLRGF